MGLSTGTKLGPYEIVAPLGAGGMGEVYRAKDPRLDRIVALKVLPEQFFENRESISRFEREAKALAAVSHPNIAVIYSFEEISGRYLLVQEFLEGETLREALTKGPLPLRKALEVGLQVAEGLAAAHGKGIVHRDVKPENIFLAKYGHAKLLDFGLARHDVARHDPADTRSPTLAAVSEKGILLGTVAYMSPEQARGEIVDFRSDQFSLGVVQYEMLTGKCPFAGASTAEMLAAIIRDEPEPVTKLDPKLPALLAWIVQRCLSKDPEERYSSTRDLVKELKSLRTHLSEAVSATEVGPAKASRLRRRVPAWMLLAVAALAVVVGLLLGTRFLKTGSPPALPVRVSLSFPLDAAPRAVGVFNPFALAPDGKTLVYAGTRSLFVRSLDRDETKPIPGTEGAVSPFFSPDGLWVGYFAGEKLKKVPLDGSPPVTLCDFKESARLPDSSAGSWGADGTIVFMAGSFSGLRRIPASGGDARTLTTTDTAKSESHLHPQILPGGENVLFAIDAPNSRSRAAVVSLRTGTLRTVAEDAAYPRYLSTGHLVFTRGGSLFAAPFSLKRLEVSGLAVPVLDDVVTNRGFTGAASMALSTEGTLVYASKVQLQRTLGWVDRRGAAEPPAFPPGGYTDVRLSPDGTHLAAFALDKDESMALLFGDFARGMLTRSPVEGIFDGLVWAPDGRRIAVGVAATSWSATRVHWLSADGSTPLEPLDVDTRYGEEVPSAVSPDGGVMLLSRYEYAGVGPSATLYDIYVLPLSGERRPYPFLKTRFTEGNGSFSPDGQWVAYHSNEPGRFEVFVRPYPGPGPKWQISTEGGRLARWSKNGRELFYRNGEKMMAVDVETKPTFRAGRPRLLFEGPFLSSYNVDTDDKRFFMIKRDPVESGPPRVNVVLNWFAEVERRVPGAK